MDDDGHRTASALAERERRDDGDPKTGTVMKRWSRVVGILAIAGLSVGAGQGNPSGFELVVSVDSYVAPMYVDDPTPPARYVLFTKEPVVVVFEIQNRSDRPRRLVLDGLAQADIDAFRVVSMPVGAHAPTIDVFREVELDRAVVAEIPGPVDCVIPPFHHAVLRAALSFGANAVPGVYQLQFVPQVRSSAVRALGTMLRVDLRQSDRVNEEVEIIRHRLQLAYLARNQRSVDECADAILRLYSDCAYAYEVKGMVARDEGRVKDADSFFNRALTLIGSRQDSLFVEHRPAEAISRHEESLRRAISELTDRK